MWQRRGQPRRIAAAGADKRVTVFGALDYQSGKVRTLMTRGLVGRDDAELAKKDTPERIANHKARGALIGTPNEIVDQLVRYAGAGIQGVQLQWLDLDDLSGLELIASEVLPQLR